MHRKNYNIIKNCEVNMGKIDYKELASSYFALASSGLSVSCFLGIFLGIPFLFLLRLELRISFIRLP